VEFAISRTPNAELGFMLLVVELLKGFQLTDLDITVLDLDALLSAELIHLGIVFRCKDLFFLGQLLIKFQP
jgi:hypothetical protein